MSDKSVRENRNELVEKLQSVESLSANRGATTGVVRLSLDCDGSIAPEALDLIQQHGGRLYTDVENIGDAAVVVDRNQ